MLPHYRNFKAAIDMFEPVVGSQFEITFILPDSAKNKEENNIMLLQHVKNIDGLDGLNPSIEAIQQKGRYIDRSYASFPSQTSLDLSMTFTMNLNDYNDNYIYNALKQWVRMTWDIKTGMASLKKFYTGKMIIVQYNRDGSIWRKITCEQVFPTGQLSGLGSLSYDSHDAQEITLNVKCDLYDEEVLGEYSIWDTQIDLQQGSRNDGYTFDPQTMKS